MLCYAMQCNAITNKLLISCYVIVNTNCTYEFVYSQKENAYEFCVFYAITQLRS